MNDKDLGLATEIVLMAIVICVILVFLGIGLLVLVHVCVAGRAVRFADNSAVDGGISQDDIEKLPSYDYMAQSKGSSPVDCAVCLSNFQAGDKCRMLPICKHSFHAQCVDTWLLKTPICPICRTTADSRRFGQVLGEESCHFSDTTVDIRASQTTTESSIVGGGGGGGSHFSDASVELRDQIQVIEPRQSNGDRSQVNNGGTDLSTRNQTILVATQLSPDPCLPSDPYVRQYWNMTST